MTNGPYLRDGPRARPCWVSWGAWLFSAGWPNATPYAANPSNAWNVNFNNGNVNNVNRGSNHAVRLLRANRKGKGSHAAADRLQTMMRQRQGRGWYSQLDVHNYFNSIHRPTLYALLCHRLARAQRQGRIAPQRALALRSLYRRLLCQPTAQHYINPRQAATVPPHKRLVNAAPGCGIPIGNLTSQFFANVVLNELDQYVRHHLKVRHYVRYVDDFVLLADDEATLQGYQQAIAAFLQDRLLPRWTLDVATLSQQCEWLRSRWPGACCRVQKAPECWCTALPRPPPRRRGAHGAADGVVAPRHAPPRDLRVDAT